MKKKISSSLKLKITLEVFKGDMTIGELVSKYAVGPALGGHFRGLYELKTYI
mgnify:CR=1 FL=1